MSKTIRVWIETNKVGSRCELTFVIDDYDESTDEDIQGMAEELRWNMAEWGWEIVE